MRSRSRPDNLFRRQEAAMTFRLLGVACFVALLGIAGVGTVFSGEVEKEDCFYLKSLHYTAAGMEYWYSEENGGLEQWRR
jgi:hypothetical protein